jgi:hypothetical protein
MLFGDLLLSADYVISEYMEYYHKERPHQGLNHEIIEPPPLGKGKIVCHQRLGGLLKSWRRAA